jgi:predicted dehydrogenase
MSSDLAKIAIVGCGLIGLKRANALAGARLVACADKDQEKAETFARHRSGCVPFGNWRDLLEGTSANVIIVATSHDSLAEITRAAVLAGKHVLVEKPACRNVRELEQLESLVETAGVCVRIGFNHRFHRAFRKARAIVDSGELGSLMYVRARYGHGGRLGYEKEWRADPRISGGGELIDQGVHLIDLARWFLGDFVEVNGHAQTSFWNMPVDDNAFLLLRTESSETAFLHASCTEWKNTFSFEIYGKTGKLQIDGLGGSYGMERLSWYQMLPEMGPPETSIWEYPMADDSWEVEMAEFLDDIRLKRMPNPGIRDAISAMKIVAKIYEKSGYDNCA